PPPDREQVAPAPLARDVRPAPSRLTAGHLVELVQEHDAVRLRAVDRLARHLARVDEAPFLLRLEDLARVLDRRLAPLLLAAEETRQHLLDVDVHLLDALVGDDLEGWKGLV